MDSIVISEIDIYQVLLASLVVKLVEGVVSFTILGQFSVGQLGLI